MYLGMGCIRFTLGGGLSAHMEVERIPSQDAHGQRTLLRSVFQLAKILYTFSTWGEGGMEQFGFHPIARGPAWS